MTKRLWITILLIGAGLLVACGALIFIALDSNRLPGQKLSFETIERQAVPDGPLGDAMGQQPKVLILTNVEAASTLPPFISGQALTTLKEIDYRTHFGLFFFGGVRPSPEGGFGIQRIYR